MSKPISVQHCQATMNNLGENAMHANEVWISVYVNGPQPEINQLRKLCAISEN
jgi:hypothetical protein